jgi:hypothetical protein
MTGLRIVLLLSALIGLSWFSFVNEATGAELQESLADRFDSRPAHRVLIVGNSRTYSHDMPRMIRAIADSAGSGEKYQITERAYAGAHFHSHWDNQLVRQQLDDKWESVVLQGASGEHIEEQDSRSFLLYGDRLAAEVKAAGSRPFLAVAWNYGPPIAEEFERWQVGSSRRYFHRIQRDYRLLAQRTGSGLIDVGDVWKDVTEAKPPFDLLEDGNHPSVHGSYLHALLVYAQLSGDDLSRVTYVPDGVSAPDGLLLRKLAAASLASRARASNGH